MHPPCRDFAQRSILSLFSAAASDSRNTRGGASSSVSLVEFLDKRLGKHPTKKQECEGRQESKHGSFAPFHPSQYSQKELSVEPATQCSGRASDSLQNRRLSNKRDVEEVDENDNRLTKLQTYNVTGAEKTSGNQRRRCNDSQCLETHHSHLEQRKSSDPVDQRGKSPKTSLKRLQMRRSRLSTQEPRSKKQLRNSSRHLLVIGDDPASRSKVGRSWIQERKPFIFNHYADGRGWWDTDMVGLDSEGVGSVGEWEGVGTMSLGNSLGPTV